MTGLGYSENRPILQGELPRSDWLVEQTERFAEIHPDRNYYVVGVEATDEAGIWSQRTLTKVAELSDAVAEFPWTLGRVQSLATWDHVTATQDTVAVRPLMTTPPGEPEEIARLRATVEADPLLHGRLVSEDGRMALVRVTVGDAAAEEDVHAGLEELRMRFEGPEQIAVFGMHHINREIDFAIAEHLGVLLPISIGLLLVFLYLSFGRWQAVWAPATLLGLAVVDFIGLMGILQIPRSVLSSVVPLLLVVVLGSYVVHFLRRAYEESEHCSWTEAIEISLRRTGLAIALAATTTAIGFVTLAAFQIFSVREFGLLSAGGVGIAGLLSITWLPACLAASGGKPQVRPWGRGWYIACIDHLTGYAVAVQSRRRRLRIAAACVCVLAITGIWRLELGSNPPEFFPRGHHVRRGFEALLNHFGGNGFLFVLIEAGDGEDVCNPEFLSKVSDFQRFAGSVEPIAFATSAVDMVLKRMNRRMNGDDPEQERLPESRQLVAQYLEVYRWDAAETLSELVENADTPRHLIVDLFANVNDSARISVLIDELRLDLQSLFEQAGNGRATFGGEFATWSAQNRYIVRGKLASLVAAICLVGFICLLVLRDRGSAVAALIPTVFASVVVFGAMGFIGIRLDLASCVITSIVVGVGVDFSIHFLLRDREIRREQLAFLVASEPSARVPRCA